MKDSLNAPPPPNLCPTTYTATSIPRDYMKALPDYYIRGSSTSTCNTSTDDFLEYRIERITLDNGPEMHAVDDVKEAAPKGVHDSVVAHDRGAAKPCDLEPRLHWSKLRTGPILRIQRRRELA